MANRMVGTKSLKLDRITGLRADAQNGAMLIGVGVIVLIAGPFAKLAAYGAIAYGAWTIWKRED